MKTFLKLLAVGVLALTAGDVITASTAFAQRNFSSQRIVLDDGNNTGRLTISYLGPGDADFVIPPGGATTVPMGTIAGQTLAWDGAMWQAMNNLTNVGGNVTVATGNFSVAIGTLSGDGSGLTNLNASNIAMGTLSDARLSSNVALLDVANNFTQTNTFPTVNATTVGASTVNTTSLTATSADITTVNSTTVTATTVNGSFVGNGGSITGLDASNISTGSLNLARISTVGADAGEALMYNGFDLVYGNPSATSLVLPVAQSDNSASTLFSQTNNGTGNAIDGTSMDGYGVYGVSTNNYAVIGSSFNNTGVYGSTIAAGMYGVLGENTQVGGYGIGGTAINGVAGRFNGAIGVEITFGSFVGSYVEVPSGSTFSVGVVTVLVQDNGLAAVPASAAPGFGASNGQIIIVGTDDPDGVTVEGVTVGPTETITLTFLGGSWRAR